MFFDEDDIEDYKDVKGSDPAETIESIKDFIRFNDTSMEIKTKLATTLFEASYRIEQEESSTPYKTNEEELFDKSFELSDKEIKQQFSFKIDGRELTEEEYARMIAAVRFERQLKEQMNRSE